MTRLGKAVGRKPGPRALTVARAVFLEVSAAAAKQRGTKWPKVQWQNDPVGFVRTELGEEPEPHQIAVMLDICAGKKVSVRSGTKTGKTKTIVWLALWFYCSFPEARVFLTATTNDQIDRTVWKEMQFTLARAKGHGFEIEAAGTKAVSGIHSADGREISGFTSSNPIALQGLSGKAMFFIGDEAASLTDVMAETILGNLMGGARLLWMGNPNGSFGPFFDSHHKNKSEFSTYVFNSEAVAQSLAAANRRVPGLATLADIEDFERIYTRGTSGFATRVLGEYMLDDTDRIFPRSLIFAAQEAWHTLPSDEGLLRIGVDPAGDGVGGDETAISVVRGRRQLELLAFRGITDDAIVVNIRGLLAKYRQGAETPEVMVDSEGPIGSKVYGKLWAIAGHLKVSNPALAYDVHGIKSGHPPKRDPLHYHKHRDELHANLREWLTTGGIVLDYKLEAELQLPAFRQLAEGKAQATPKDAIRTALSRSPDRLDALMLSVWDPRSRVYKEAIGAPRESTLPERPAPQNDPWAGLGDYDRGGGIDPYG